MVRFSLMVLLGLSAATLGACDAPLPPPPAHAAEPVPSPEQLRRIVERYWDDDIALQPWYSWYGADTPWGAAPGDSIAPQSLADSLDLERRYLTELAAITPAALDAESRLTYDLFRRERLLAIEGFTYPFELLPVNPYDGMPVRFAAIAAAAERLALSSPMEYAAWNSRAESFVRWTNQAIQNMRDGMRRGYTLSRPLVQKTLPQLAALATDSEANVFYRPIESGVPFESGGANSARPADPGAQPASSPEAMRAVIKDKIVPAYRELHDFLEHEYLPRSRTSVALAALPMGEAWYAYLVKRATGGTLTPAQLHALGLSEVERLHQRLQALLADGAFAGNVPGFIEHMRHDPQFSYSTAADLSAAYHDLKARVASAAPTLFPVLPRVDFDIRTVAAYREAVAAPLSYRPRAPNGELAAVLDVNMAELETGAAIDAPARYLREAVPGHHYQLELQRERADLPRFRRFGSVPAFIEGWGLYAATLGEELGLDDTAEAKFGSLRAQVKCAALMVVDTGVHAEGWTRQKALDYLHAELPGDDAEVVEAVDRVLALPAEALACTSGFLEMQALRTAAQQSLGDLFDVRDFHYEVVRDGALPLDMLDLKLKAWIKERIAAAAAEAAAARAAASAAASAAAASSVE